MNYALMSSGLMALLLIALSFNVSLTRARTQRGYGNEPDPTAWLTKAVRAQGNAAEYIPLFLVLILILEVEGSANWADWVYIATCATRYAHAAGMLMSSDLNKPHPVRVLGSAGTYVCGFILAGLVIYGAL